MIDIEVYTEILSQTANLTEAPEYIRVLPLGYVSSEKGDFLVDNESFHMMKEYMEHRAVDIVIDYEHQTLKDVQAPAGGWIKELVLILSIYLYTFSSRNFYAACPSDS